MTRAHIAADTGHILGLKGPVMRSLEARIMLRMKDFGLLTEWKEIMALPNPGRRDEEHYEERLTHWKSTVQSAMTL
jgi:hypothetical protein